MPEFCFQIIIIKISIGVIVKDDGFCCVLGIVCGCFCFEVKDKLIIKVPSNWLRIVISKNVYGGGDGVVGVDKIVIKLPSIGTVIVYIGWVVWVMFWVKQC